MSFCRRTDSELGLEEKAPEATLEGSGRQIGRWLLATVLLFSLLIGLLYLANMGSSDVKVETSVKETDAGIAVAKPNEEYPEFQKDSWTIESALITSEAFGAAAVAAFATVCLVFGAILIFCACYCMYD